MQPSLVNAVSSLCREGQKLDQFNMVCGVGFDPVMFMLARAGCVGGVKGNGEGQGDSPNVAESRELTYT